MTSTPRSVVALEAAADVDLSPLTDRLWRERIPHRVVAHADRQLLLVLDEESAERVRTLGREVARALAAGADKLPHAGIQLGPLWQGLRSTPCVAVILLLSLVFAPFAMLGAPVGLLEHLFILPAQTPLPIAWMPLLATLGHALAQGELWRLFTPCLLHFSIAHLAMDAALFLDFGRRVERVFGSFVALCVFLVIGCVSNVGQLLSGHGAEFGGLSGIVTGQLGFLVLAARRFGDERLRIAPAIAVGLVLSLVVFSTGVTEAFGLYVANTAHWVGLAMGVVLAALWPRPKASS